MTLWLGHQVDLGGSRARRPDRQRSHGVRATRSGVFWRGDACGDRGGRSWGPRAARRICIRFRVVVNRPSRWP